MLAAEDRRREIGTRRDILQKRPWRDAGEIGRFDCRDDGFTGLDHLADRLQEPVLRARASQEELNRRHPARVRLFHQVGVAVQLLGIPPQMLQHLEVTGKWFAHKASFLGPLPSRT